MDPTGDKAGDLDRRRSTRASVRISVDNGDDDYEFAMAGMVADGFRPAHHSADSAGPSTPSLTSASTATLLAEESPSPRSNPRPPRPSSTAKPPNPQYVLSVRPEPNALARQTTSSTDATAYLPADGPYQGPSGPAHPYQMYPQNVRSARTASTATASTVPVSDSPYRGPRGPSHPYGLYPQSGAIEPDGIQAPAIPLGFRGLPDQYQRRVGPDGEEVADMIGPDGHTEQLPPYTRYPDEAYTRKATAMDAPPDTEREGAAVVPPLATSASAIPAISGAGGLGLATRNPEFESGEDDPGSPRSRYSTRSFVSDDSGRRIRSDDEGLTEKQPPPKKWQTWMRRKLWGVVPYWAICLTGLVLLVIIAILGAVVGTFMAKQRRPPARKEGDWSPSFDTTPISTPSDLQPLPTGTFAMPLPPPSRISSTCFQNPTLSQTWRCNLVMTGLYLTVLKDGNNYRASVDCNHSYTLMNHVYAYGEQPPLIMEPVSLDLVGDKYEPSRGPAWFKMLSYNKTVILPENVLDASGSSSTNSQQVARYADSPNSESSNFKRKDVAQRGEKPWVCTWPGTYLELFIYAQQNSSYSNWGSKPASLSSSSSTDSSTSSATPSQNSRRSPADADVFHATETFANQQAAAPKSSSTSTNSPSSKSKYGNYGPQNLAHSPDPTSSSTTTTTTPPPPPPTSTPPPPPPQQTSTSTSQSTSAPSPNDGNPSSSSSSSSGTTTTASSTTSSSPYNPIDTGDNWASIMMPYPRVIKLEERRISTASAPRAMCTQVEIQGPRQEAKPVLDDQGRPVVIEIGETDYNLPASTDSSTSAAAATSAAVGRRGGETVPDISPCGCMWYLT